jgi:hypothetical protein
MNIHTLFHSGNLAKKLSKLSTTQIEHLIQLKLNEIENYKRAIKNDPPERMVKYGLPFLERLNGELQTLKDHLKK